MTDPRSDAEIVFQRYLDGLGEPGAPSREAFLESEVPERLRAEVENLIRRNEELARRWAERALGDVASETWRPRGLALGRYRLTRTLGAGATSRVWEAEDELLGRRVALKVFHGILEDPRRSERMRLEARALAGLASPGVVRLFEMHLHDGVALLATELHGTGDTLREVLARGDPAWNAAGARERCRLLLPALEGLAEAHEAGLLHRDLKPSNLLWNGATFKLADFGLAHSSGSDLGLTLTGEFVGTHAYAAPEQHEGGVAGPTADVFAFAATLYEALTGERLFGGDSPLRIRSNILAGERPWSPAFRALPRDLRAVLQHALHQRPADRYADAGAFARDLRDWIEGRPVRARLPDWSRRARMWTSRHPWQTAVCTISVLGTAAVIALWQDAARESDNTRSVLQTAQGILRTIDPLYPASERGSMRDEILRLPGLLDQIGGLPDAELGELWRTVGAGLMRIEAFQDAADAFRRSEALRPDAATRVHLAWCLREISSREPLPDAREDALVEARVLLAPIAARAWTGVDSDDFVTALARNRMATLPIEGRQSEMMGQVRAELREIASIIENREGMEPWLAPMNRVNLGVSYVFSDELPEALAEFQAAERLFRSRNLTSHPEYFYALVGQAQVLSRMGRHPESREAAMRALNHRREQGLGYTEATLSFQVETAGQLRAFGFVEEANHLLDDAAARAASPLLESELPERTRADILRQVEAMLAAADC